MCHESSGKALEPTIGIGKGTVTLADFNDADTILVIGQNPGTNHPRMLTALRDAKLNGSTIIHINPLSETGLVRFKHPQDYLTGDVKSTQLADLHVPVRSGGAGGDYNDGGLRAGQAKYKGRKLKGLKPKDLIGVPWRVALALQADGWYLRNEIIWSKSNPMPESVRDRLTRSHEHIFLFAHPDSGGKYYYDIEAIKEPSVTGELFHGGYDALMPNGKKGHSRNGRHENADNTTTTRNKRTVWNVNPSSFKGAHFATWPTGIVEPMVLAGCPKGGQVLDPFSGSGTTGQVALNLGRNYVGIDLNEDYFFLAECRVQGIQATKPKEDVPEMTTLDMFGVD